MDEDLGRVSSDPAEKRSSPDTAFNVLRFYNAPPISTAVEQSREAHETVSAKRAGEVSCVDMRPFMATFPTGVGVITALHTDGHPWGMTCTSLCSVTLKPPTLLICLRQDSPTLDAVLASGGFALNLLNSSARPIAELFASGLSNRFERVAWHLPAVCRGPHLMDAAHSVADCQVINTATLGDHTVVFGEVLQVTQQAEPLPLLYGFRRYQRWPENESN